MIAVRSSQKDVFFNGELARELAYTLSIWECMLVHPRSQMCVYRCKCVHTGLVHPPLWPSTPWASNWWLAPGQHSNTLFYPRFLSLPLCCSDSAQPESHRNSAPGALGTLGHRAIFSWGHHKHTRPGEGPPFDRGEPWKLAATTRPVFSVSLSPEPRPESRRRQRSS